MELQNGYKVIYEKAADGKRTFYASKSNAYPAAEDIELASFDDADFEGKVIYEHKGKFYVSVGNLPAYDENGMPTDTLIEGFDEVFKKTTAADTTTEIVIQNPHAEAISTNGDSHGKLSVNGDIVTLNATGTVKWLKSATEVYGNWVGFKVTAPEGTDPANIIITRPDNETRVLANILDGENYAHMYWNFAERDLIATYYIDWDNDGTNDLTVVIDATEATLEAAPLEEVAE